MHTPWGRSDYSEPLAKGIVFYGTPSHGGIHLSTTRQVQMPEVLRRPDPWYEKDCDYARVFCAFPEEFPPEKVARAKESLKNWFPEAYEAYYRETIPPGESFVKDEREFLALHRNHFLVQAAWGDWYEECPKGHVLVCAKKESTGEKAFFLLKEEEYKSRGQMKYVVDDSCPPVYPTSLTEREVKSC